MNRADEFMKNSVISKNGAKEVCEIIKELAVWKENCNILEVGCGPGNVTHDYLLPILPKFAKSVICIDKNPEVIDYAKEHYGQSSNLVFKQLDIVKDVDDLQTYEDHFDHILSFYCLQYIREVETALRNIYRILKPGGDFFFTCDVQNNLFSVCEYMCKIPEWEPLLGNYRNTLFSLQFSPTPIAELNDILSKVGFVDIALNVTPQEFLLPFETLTEFGISHSPFEVPPSLENEFGVVGKDVIRKLNLNRFDDNGKEYCYVKLQFIFGHVWKPHTSV